MAMARKKKNRKKTPLITAENERKVVRSSLTMMGFISVFGCIALLSWAAANMSDPATLPIRGVKVEGDFKFLHTRTLERLVVDKVDGGFFTVDVDRIRDSVLSAPWVREVTVRKMWPDSLYVKIHEQKAIVRWGDKGFLNGKGELFEPEKTEQPQGLIQLDGPRGTEAQVYKKYRRLVAVLNPYKRHVAWVRLNDRRGWSFGISNGPTVVIGKKEVAARIRRYTNEVETNFGQDIGNIMKVDLRYTNGFTIRRKADEQDAEVLSKINSANDTRGT